VQVPLGLPYCLHPNRGLPVITEDFTVYLDSGEVVGQVLAISCKLIRYKVRSKFATLDFLKRAPLRAVMILPKFFEDWRAALPHFSARQSILVIGG